MPRIRLFLTNTTKKWGLMLHIKLKKLILRKSSGLINYSNWNYDEKYI